MNLPFQNGYKLLSKIHKSMHINALKSKNTIRYNKSNIRVYHKSYQLLDDSNSKPTKKNDENEDINDNVNERRDENTILDDNLGNSEENQTSPQTQKEFQASSYKKNKYHSLRSVISKAIELVVNREHPDSKIDDPWISKIMLIHSFAHLSFLSSSMVGSSNDERSKSYGGFNKIGFSIQGPSNYPNSIFLIVREYAKKEGINFIDLDFKFLSSVMRMYIENRSLKLLPIDRIQASARDFALIRYTEVVELIFEELVNYLEVNNPNKDKKYFVVVKNFYFKNFNIAYALKKLVRSLEMKITFIDINTGNELDFEQFDFFVNKALTTKKKLRGNIDDMNATQSRSQMSQAARSNLFGCDPVDLTPSSLNPLYAEKWKELERSSSKDMILYENKRHLNAFLDVLHIILHGDITRLNHVLSNRLLEWREIRSIIRIAMKLKLMNSDEDEVKSIDVSHLLEAFDLVMNIEPKKNRPNDEIDLTELEQRAMKNFVEPDWIETSFDDIGSLSHAKEEILSLLVPLRMKAFQDYSLIKSPSGILLYGPPGTGKTMLARALAKTAKAFFIHISASSIISKWFGESEDNVAAIFSLAKKRSPSIIFIDEVDGLLQIRDSSDHENSRRVKNEFFSCWDGLLSGSNSNVTVIAATNRPFDLDSAALRRLPHKVLIPLPDKKARREIFQKILRNVDITLEYTKDAEISQEERDEVLDTLSKMTENYSGSDIKSVCVRAGLQLVRDFMKIDEYNDMMKNEDNLVELETIAGNYAMRPISMKEFTTAIHEISPSVDPKSITQLEMMKWHQIYGHKENKKITLSTLGF